MDGEVFFILKQNQFHLLTFSQSNVQTHKHENMCACLAGSLVKFLTALECKKPHENR